MLALNRKQLWIVHELLLCNCPIPHEAFALAIQNYYLEILDIMTARGYAPTLDDVEHAIDVGLIDHHASVWLRQYGVLPRQKTIDLARSRGYFEFARHWESHVV